MPRRGTLVPFFGVVLGAGLFGLADGAIGLSESGLSLRGVGQHAVYFLLCAGQVMLAGIVLGLALSAMLALLAKPRILDAGGNGFSIGLVLLALLGATLCEIWNLDLFHGAGVRGQPWRPAAEWAFRLLSGPLVFAGILTATRFLRRPRRRHDGIMLLVAAVVLLCANRAYRQQYVDIHLQIAIAALAAMSAGADALVRGTKLDPVRSAASAVIVSALAAAVALGSVHASRVHELARAYAAADAAFATRAFGVAQFEPLISRVAALAGKPMPEAPPTVDVGALLQKLAPQLAWTDRPPRPTQAATLETLDRIAPGRRDWNVLWIALDTVRADHVGHLGYSRKTTPNLDRLADEGFVFESAHTAYPTSNYGFCSALTSLAARASPVYGRRFHESYRYDASQALPALLSRNGRVAAAVTAFDRATLDSPTFFKELKEGFQVFNPDQTESSADGAEVTASAIKLLNGRLKREDKPFFLWVHYLDPHDPYVNRPEFDFGRKNIDRYDSEIAYADRAAGMVLEALERSGRADKTIVVAFADHGEEFNEHGGRFHNGSVYEEQIRVPLVIRIPGVKGRRVKCPVSLLDLTPTMCDLLGIADPAPRHGRSLLPLMLGQDDDGMAYSEVFVERAQTPIREVRAVTVGRKKLLHRVQENRFELYDLERDPRERDSLIGQGDPEEARLRGVLARWDVAIDKPFLEPAGPTVAEKIEQIIPRLTDPASQVAWDAVADLRTLLLSGYGTVRLDLMKDIGEPEITAAFDKLAALVPRVQGDVPQGLLWMLSHRRDPKLAATFRQALNDPKMPERARLAAAVALASIDDASGRGLLDLALASPLVSDKADVATSLVRLGDPTGLTWWRAALDDLRWGSRLRDAILALPKLKNILPGIPGLADVTPARFVRNRVVHELSRHHEVNMALIEALSGDKDEDALLVLLRLMRCDDDVVRAAARRALLSVLPENEVDRNRAAMDEEVDADSTRLNRQSGPAADAYRSALERGTLKNVGLRFRLATVLRDANRLDEARQALEEIERIAPIGFDRTLARRRIEQLRWPWQTDPTLFKCTVVEVKLPDLAGPDRLFGASFRLRNDGPAIWEGGWKAGAVELVIRFLDPAGNAKETWLDLEIANHLPETGVNPGETVEVFVLGAEPPEGERGPMVLSFRNERVKYQNGGVVWREPASSSRPANTHAPR